VLVDDLDSLLLSRRVDRRRGRMVRPPSGEEDVPESELAPADQIMTDSGLSGAGHPARAVDY
jgi:hypothetical protein